MSLDTGLQSDLVFHFFRHFIWLQCFLISLCLLPVSNYPPTSSFLSRKLSLLIYKILSLICLLKWILQNLGKITNYNKIKTFKIHFLYYKYNFDDFVRIKELLKYMLSIKKCFWSIAKLIVLIRNESISIKMINQILWFDFLLRMKLPLYANWFGRDVLSDAKFKEQLTPALRNIAQQCTK